MDQGLIKQRAKQAVRRTIGEPYVGKRLKIRSVSRELRRLDLHPRSILDAGAEDATFVYWLADRYRDAQVAAVDIDEAAIRSCVEARPARYAERVQFRVSRFADLDPESFDLITAFDVLEHIDDDAVAAADLYRALRPGGLMLVHVPRGQWRNRHGETYVPVTDDEIRFQHSGHVRAGYQPDALRSLLASAGFEVLTVETWTRQWAVLAYDVYTRLERPAPLRLLSIPVTDVMSVLDRRRPADEGNTVWAVARKN